ncbi:MAG: polyprenyl synthetase family protein [Candidatus Omnitrophica bacterium]|nr:polyprenyl synthetase family protein [Candidatus Omnitrophota bacterium]
MKPNLKNSINQHLHSFIQARLKNYKLNRINNVLDKRIKEFIFRDGKRVRPIFFLLAYSGYSRKKQLPNDIILTSLAFELLHDFLLVHDDIIDNADTRRGKPTMHRMLQKSLKQPEKIGKDLSIIVGDIIYALALEAFLSAKAKQKDKETALQIFLSSTILTGAGEFIDILNGLSPITKVGLKHIRMNYLLKTAEYTFKSPLACGCVLAGAPITEVKKLLQLGEFLGEGFQINDDLIGIFSQSKKIGKSVLSDIIEAKKTLPIFLAYKKACLADKAFINKSLGNKNLKYSDLQKIRKIIITTGAYAQTKQAINKLLQKAETLIDSLKMNNNQKQLFKNYILSFIKS